MCTHHATNQINSVLNILCLGKSNSWKSLSQFRLNLFQTNYKGCFVTGVCHDKKCLPLPILKFDFIQGVGEALYIN